MIRLELFVASALSCQIFGNIIIVLCLVCSSIFGFWITETKLLLFFLLLVWCDFVCKLLVSHPFVGLLIWWVCFYSSLLPLTVGQYLKVKGCEMFNIVLEWIGLHTKVKSSASLFRWISVGWDILQRIKAIGLIICSGPWMIRIEMLIDWLSGNLIVQVLLWVSAIFSSLIWLQLLRLLLSFGMVFIFC